MHISADQSVTLLCYKCCNSAAMVHSGMLYSNEGEWQRQYRYLILKLGIAACMGTC